MKKSLACLIFVSPSLKELAGAASLTRWCGIILIAAMLTGWAAGGERSAAGSNIVNRDEVMKVVRSFDDPLLETRVNAIRGIADWVTAPEVAKELQINERLIMIALDTDSIPRVVRERKEALKSLATLYGRGFGSQDMIKHFITIIEDKRGNVPMAVRMQALDLIAQVGAPKAKADPISSQAFNALKNLLSASTGLPPAPIIARGYQALGAMYSNDNKGINQLMTNALRSNSAIMQTPEARTGILSGLTTYLNLSGDSSRAVFDELNTNIVSDRVSRAKPEEKSAYSDERMMAMQALSVWLRNSAANSKAQYPSLSGNPQLRDTILKIFNEESDNEASAALSILLQIVVDDVNIVNAFLNGINPDRNPPRSPELRHAIVMALANVLASFPSWNARRLEESELNITQSITSVYTAFLTQNQEAGVQYDAPAALRVTAIFGLGMLRPMKMPNPSDSRPLIPPQTGSLEYKLYTNYFLAIDCLIKVLEQTNPVPSLAETREACESLENLTGASTEYNLDITTGNYLVDVSAWRTWYEAKQLWFKSRR